MATATRKKERVPETLVASSRDDLERKRKGILAKGPSGAVYRLRQINLERHALSGGLPAALIQVALEGQQAIGKLFEDMAAEQAAGEGGNNAPVREYLDNLVLASVMEPALTRDDLGDPNRLDDDALVPPQDYQWLVSVAFREADTDAEGRRLWGVEPLSTFRVFRDFHGCEEDCSSCEAVRLAFSSDAGSG